MQPSFCSSTPRSVRLSRPTVSASDSGLWAGRSCIRPSARTAGLKQAGIHICVDSNGGIWNSHVEELFRLCDLVLLDVKEFSDERHRHITGRSNEQTLRTAAWLEAEGHPFWLRYVLVPGLSDAEADLCALGEHFRDYKQIERVELLPYHRLGVHKYEAMGIPYQLSDTRENTPEQLQRAESILREYFPQLVVN